MKSKILNHELYRIESLFQHVAQKYKDKLAIISENNSISYGDLDKRSTMLAHYLRLQNHKNCNLIALCLDRDVDYIVGVLGVLKSGAAFMPIDPQYPEARIEYMIHDSGVQIIITEKKFKHKFCLDDVQLICIDECQVLLNKFIIAPTLSPIDNLAYVIYTSGTTGNPKGVMIEHNSVVNLVNWHLQEFQICASENTSLFSSFSFDASIWELFPYLLNGNSIYICSDQVKSNLTVLNQFFHEYHIKIAFLPTAVCELFFAYNNSSLRILLTGGEELTKKPLHTSYKVINNYGPTESTVVTTSSLISANQAISLGKPIANMDVFVLNEQEQIVTDESPGELCIAGIGLARGYLNNKSLTAKKFIYVTLKDNKTIKLYKTGDWVKKLANGTIKFLGRKDSQIKLRGFRVDLFEVENALRSLSIIEDCAVIVKNKRLIAYYLARRSVTSIDLKEQLKNKIPSFMVPDLYQAIDVFPLTSNGKKDRVLLENLPLEHPKVNTLFPENELEQSLLAIWQRLLEFHVKPDSDFFSLGVHSIIFMQALAAIEQELQINLSIDDIYKNASVKKLAQFCLTQRSAANKPVEANQQLMEIALSDTQQQMWLLNKTDRVARYNIPIALRISSTLSYERFEFALKKLVTRHEILRTSIVEINGSPIQKINLVTEADFSLEQINQIDKETAFKLMQEDANTFFTLGERCLFRAKVFLLSTHESIIYFNFHHIIFDGWSLPLFYKELGLFYQQPDVELANLSYQYKDYILANNLRRQESVYQKSLSYWKNLLTNSEPILNLSTDFIRSKEDTGQGAKYYFTIKEPLAQQLKAVAKDKKTTVFVLLLSAFYLLLRQYSQQKSFCIGTVLANRVTPQTQNLIGCFINTVALPMQAEPAHTIAQLIEITSQMLIEAQRYQHVSFKDVVQAVQPIREEGRSPLFQVMINMLQPEKSVLHLNEVDAEEIPVEHNASVFDLSLIIEAIQSDISIAIQYRADLFKQDTIERMALHLTNVVHFMLHNDGALVTDVNLLSQENYDQIILAFNNTQTPYPHEITIDALFIEQALAHPDKIAIESDTTRLTYNELNQESNKVANLLQSLQVSQENIIGIFLEKSPNFIISMLGILKARCAYLPLDIEYPADRLSYIMENSGVRVIISNKALKEQLKTILPKNTQLIVLDEVNDVYPTPIIKGHAQELAYVIYTSGSTGKPKGVMIEHRGVVRLVRNTNYIQINPEDKFIQLASLSFDAATFEIWGALLNGAKLVIPQMKKLSLADMAYYISHYEISVMFLTSLLFKLLVESHSQELASVMTMIAGGEVVDFRNAINLFLEKNNKAAFVHAYGPTENTTFTSCHRIQSPLSMMKSIPIGIPLANTTIYILDSQLKPVPIGAPGVLYTTGDGLARGYIDAQLTQEKFITNPFSKKHSLLYNTGDLVRWLHDGTIEFIGREDNQIKIRGFRIELDEIEQAINQYPAIKESVVLVVGNDAQKKLIAYCTLRDTGRSLELSQEIKQWLKAKLPFYMIPSHFILVYQIPLTVNGKIDKNQLINQHPIQEQKLQSKPVNHLQNSLLKIWEKTLNIKPISIHDSFFDLGGDSITNILIVDQARKEGIQLHIQDIFNFDTIAQLSEQIECTELAANQSFAEPSNENVSFELTASQHFILDVNQANINTSNIGMMFLMHKRITLLQFKDVVAKLIQRHEVFILQFPHASVGRGVDKVVYTPEEYLQHRLVDTAEPLRIIQSLENQIRHNFDIATKPLVQFYFYECPQGAANFLSIHMHHLITDAFSWNILINELHSYLTNTDAVLEAPTNSYHYWSQKQKNYTQTILTDEHKKYWHSLLQQLDTANSVVMETPTAKVLQEQTIHLSKETTQFIKEYVKSTRTKMEEILLSLIYKAYKQWSGEQSMSVMIANHGRSHEFNDVSISRTMGLFTVFYPVIFSSPHIADVKKTLRDVMPHINHYFLLKYLKKELAVHKMPNILFNYMGNFGMRHYGELLTRIDTLTERNLSQEINHQGISIIGMELDEAISIILGSSHVDLSKLASLLTQEIDLLKQKTPDLGLLITFKKKIATSPIIFLPGQGSSCFSFNRLAQKLDVSYSLYGIQTFGLNTSEEPFASIEEVASYNINLLKTHYSTGPYILIGYSYGGTVAFEMAYQLQANYGDEVKVILIDAPPHQFKSLKCPIKYVQCVLSQLKRAFNLSLEIESIPSIEDIETRKQYVVSLLEQQGCLVGKNVIEHFLCLFHAQVNATYRFDNKSIPNMSIILAEELLNEGMISPDLRERIAVWQNYVHNPINYISIPGNHFNVLDVPYVDNLAKTLEGLILS